MLPLGLQFITLVGCLGLATPAEEADSVTSAPRHSGPDTERFCFADDPERLLCSVNLSQLTEVEEMASSNLSVLTKSHKIVAAKRRAKKEQIKEIVFDDTARRYVLSLCEHRYVSE